MKACRACNGPVCDFCGGCINQGECSCSETGQEKIDAQAARIVELEGALKELLANGGPLSDPISRGRAQSRARNALAKAAK